MNDIKFLLKFGKKEHIESFVNGSLYCSNAQTFWGIEDDLKIKGQGDRLEASSRIFAQKISVYDCDNGEFVGSFPASSGLVRYEPAEQIPVFCLFSVFEKDCATNSDGSLRISLSDEVKETIKSKELKQVIGAAVNSSVREGLEIAGVSKSNINTLKDMKGFALKGGLLMLIKGGIQVIERKYLKSNIVSDAVYKFFDKINDYVLSKEFIKKIDSIVNKLAAKKMEYLNKCDYLIR